MLNRDTLDQIQKTAIGDAAKRIHAAPAEPAHIYYTQDKDGSLDRVVADPQPQAHKPSDFRSLAAIAVDDDAKAIFCGLDGVVAILSDDRRDRAKLNLGLSPQFVKLQEWDRAGFNGEGLDHVTTYTIFRTLFRDSLPGSPTIRDDVRKVDVQKAQQAASDVSRTAVSMSKKLIAEASGADKLPEVLTFKVPVFAEGVATVTASVRVAFDLDPQLEKFRFIVLPKEIENAEALAEEWLESQVRAALPKESTIPVYRGEP